MKQQIKALLLALVPAAAMAAGCSTAADKTAEPVTIVATDNGWDSQKIHNEIARLVVEHAYDGYTFKESSASTTMNWQSLIKGDVDLDIESWTENIATYEEDVARGDILNLGILVEDGRQGVYVPRYVLEGDAGRGIEPMAPGLKSIQDLKKYAAVFPDDEDRSRGRMYGSIPGWMADEILYKKYEYNQLDENFTYTRLGSEAALFASLVSAYNLGEPWVGYCYEPTWIAGKLDLVLLEDEPYEPVLFTEGKCEFPKQELKICTNKFFEEKAPDLVAFFQNYATGSGPISNALAYMDDTKSSYEETAIWFLQENDALLDQWLPAVNAAKLRAYLSGETGTAATVSKWLKENLVQFPASLQFEAGQAIDDAVRSFASANQSVLRSVKDTVIASVGTVRRILELIPWVVLVLAVGLLTWHLTKKWVSSIIYMLLLTFIGSCGLWPQMLETLSIVISSVFLCILLGFPLGILLTMNQTANRILKPVLDTMQTMPSWVYLVPAVLLFSTGTTPALLATTIYAIVPMVRMTSHGLTYVDGEMLEASRAFGATPMQTLIKVQIPQARPTIMTGVNQTIMMAMSMVVTCALIGANGLGMEILLATNRVEVGKALFPGIAIVIVAVILDRLTQAAVKKSKEVDSNV